MRLSEHLDKPFLVHVDGVDYPFSRLNMDSYAVLEAWILNNVLNPIASIRPHLKGLSDEDRRYLLDQARKDLQTWPPRLGTNAAARLLAERPDLQVELMWTALKQHWPDCERSRAQALFDATKNDERSGRILRIIFGRGHEPDEDDATREIAASPKE